MSLAPMLIQAAIEASVDNMIVSNGMIFKQTDTLGLFIMDTAQSYGSPDPP